MKDIPIFTTEYGVASIVLKEIPYRGIAYVTVRDIQPGAVKQLIDECVQFCRAAGAQRVYATGHPELEHWPLGCSVIVMTGPACSQCDGNLWPVTDETVSGWRRIYNERMKEIDNAATLTFLDEKNIVSSGGAYFVHEDGRLLGIGWVEEGKLLSIASVQPGAGRQVLTTLLTAQDRDAVELEVASTNHRAIRLYESMGFIRTAERSRWYQIL